MTDLTELAARLATAKAIDDKAYRSLSSRLSPGIYPINATVVLVGGIKKGEPFKQRIAAAANPWTILAKALSKLNGATIESLVEESLAVGDEEATAIKAAADAALQRIKDATERDVSGKLTGTIEWGLLA